MTKNARTHWALLGAIVGTHLICAGARADESLVGLTWTDPAKAESEDADFLVQGEYAIDAPSGSWGIQVVALGGGKFDAYLLKGGLPGDGWDRGKPRIRLSGGRDGDSVALASADNAATATIRDGQLHATYDGRPLPPAPRTVRESETLGAQPPEDATVLFDGSSADAWVDGVVENGLLQNNDVRTRATFHDYHLHLEFRTPYKPYARGQQRGNSGVYHQGRYETQVLDSFGLEGKGNECGGVYSISAPQINACLPPLSWQTYDVDFTAARFDDDGQLSANARMTVRLNGIVVHDDLELPKTTTAAPLREVSSEPGPIFLQHHKNPVFYRNIWIVRK